MLTRSQLAALRHFADLDQRRRNYAARVPNPRRGNAYASYPRADVIRRLYDLGLIVRDDAWNPVPTEAGRVALAMHHEGARHVG